MPVVLSGRGGWGEAGREFLAAVAHPVDQLECDDLGSRFAADRQTWACHTHRLYVVQQVAVAMLRHGALWLG